jgi:hypothetical protein
MKISCYETGFAFMKQKCKCLSPFFVRQSFSEGGLPFSFLVKV